MASTAIETPPPTTESPENQTGKKRPSPEAAPADFKAAASEEPPATPATKRAKRVEGIREKLRAVLDQVTATSSVKKKAERLIDRLVNEACRTRRPGKELDEEATMKRYAERLAEIPGIEFKALHGKWMSVYGGLPKDGRVALGDLSGKLGESHVLAVLARVAASHGVAPAGGVSASTKKNPADGKESFVVNVPEADRVYVGPTLAFKGLVASPFSLTNADKVFNKPEAPAKAEPKEAPAAKQKKSDKSPPKKAPKAGAKTGAKAGGAKAGA